MDKQDLEIIEKLFEPAKKLFYSLVETGRS